MSNYNKLTEWKIEIGKPFVSQCTSNEQLKYEVRKLFKSACKSKHWVINLADIFEEYYKILSCKLKKTMEGNSLGMNRKLHIVKILISSFQLDLWAQCDS